MSPLLLVFCLLGAASCFPFENFGKYKMPQYNQYACNCRILDDSERVPLSTVTPTTQLPEVIVVHKTEFHEEPKVEESSFLRRFFSFFTKNASWQRDDPVESGGPSLAGRLAAFGKTLSFLDRLECSCEGNAMDVLKAGRFLRFSVTYA